MLAKNILIGVGKKLRNGYLNGAISEDVVNAFYKHNKKEADEFDSFGMSLFDLQELKTKTHNPLLSSKLQELILDYKNKITKGHMQNMLSLKKLSFYKQFGLGIGLRNVIKALKNLVKLGEKEARIVLGLLDIEFANLTAKLRSNKKNLIYERKDILLDRISDMLYDNGWRCGINYNPGKNANYLIYVYLPNGEQLSWHCNDYRMLECYDEIKCEFDGKVCSTLEKLLNYVHKRFGIGMPMEQFIYNVL